MAASSKRRVHEKVTPIRGRSLFTTEHVAAGSVLFEEEPLVCSQFSWNAHFNYVACEYCLRSLETAEQNARRLSKQDRLALPHPECCETQPLSHAICQNCGTKYCSVQCRGLANEKYHRVLCEGSIKEKADHPLQILDNTWKNMHYPPETTTINLFVKLFAMVQQTENKDVFLSQLKMFCSKFKDEGTNQVHKLLGEQFTENFEVLREMISHLFGDVVPNWVTPEGFKSLFAMVGRNGQGIGTSSLSVWVNNCDSLVLPDTDRQRLDEFIDELYKRIKIADATCCDEDGNEQYCEDTEPFLDCQGSGLYVTQSAANHSCVPNAVISFPHNNSVCRATATRDIPADQEVFISYLDECTLERSRHSRQKELGENYLFECECEKCMLEANDPDVTSEEESDVEYSEEDYMS